MGLDGIRTLVAGWWKGSPVAVATTDATLAEELRHLWGAPIGAFQGSDGAFDHRAALGRDASALCLSGGGIRSAAFALGVLQALARKGLLTQFNYLSTVSGGGYIGGWLTRWIKEAGSAAAVEEALAAKGKTREPEEVRRLREGSNFLTPTMGLTSGDTWSVVALCTRNIVLNWLVFAPALLLVVAVLNFYLALMHTVAIASGEPAREMVPSGLWATGFLLAGALLLLLAVFAACRFLPSHAPRPTAGGPPPFWLRRGTLFFIRSAIVIPSLLWALLLAVALAPTVTALVEGRVGWSLEVVAAVAFLAAVAGYGLALATVPRSHQPHYLANYPAWLLAAAVSAAGIVLGARVFRLVPEAPSALFDVWASPVRLALFACLFPLWVMLCHLLLSTLFVGLRSGRSFAGGGETLMIDLDREWLGRLSGIKVWPTFGWALVTAACFLLPSLVFDNFQAFGQAVTGAVGAIAGVVAVFGGKSGMSRFQPSSGGSLFKRRAVFEAILTLATAIFIALLLMAFSRIEMLLAQAVASGAQAPAAVAHLLIAGLAGAAMVATSRFVGVNRFSLHGVYRNRLARAFLGAARASRTPDDFTGFDAADNVRMNAVGPPEGSPVLFPVINLCLNIVRGRRLAWQERKAAPFIVTPLACGSAALDADLTGDTRVMPTKASAGAFVPSSRYAGNERDLGLKESSAGGENSGISLATAIATSGAAASPNMGYHSSPATAFLMTLFNVRLGIWLGNPAARNGERVKLSNPRFALWPLLSELLGNANADSSYVYLSDGGHFENLGLYEMVRRRCRYIVVSDAGSDPDCGFADLGNAVRKIAIDLHVKIEFEPIRIAPRPPNVVELGKLSDVVAYAVGTITYPEGRGVLLYIKPTLMAGLPADVVAYAAENATFPHETTADQWFAESQFESYRRLGEWSVDQILSRAISRPSIKDLFEAVSARARPVAPPTNRWQTAPARPTRPIRRPNRLRSRWAP